MVIGPILDRRRDDATTERVTRQTSRCRTAADSLEHLTNIFEDGLV